MLKRDPVKYVRDKAKSNYVKGESCEICGTTEKLDFHHYYSMSLLLNKYAKENGLDLQLIIEWRDEFIDEHDLEIYEETATLCRTHHLKLHSIYGKEPLLVTAPKQKRWVKIQRDKNGLV